MNIEFGLIDFIWLICSGVGGACLAFYAVRATRQSTARAHERINDGEMQFKSTTENLRREQRENHAESVVRAQQLERHVEEVRVDFAKNSVSREEYIAGIARVHQRIDDGFNSVNNRLDQINASLRTIASKQNG